MRDRAAFAVGMTALGVNCRVEVTDAQRELYWTMLSDLGDDDFQRAVYLTLQHARYFPTIAELRQAVTPHVDYRADAVVCFERVCKLGTHDPVVGTRWRRERIEQAEGPVAAEAFSACGGSKAFELEQGDGDLTFLRKRFVDSYALAAEAQAKGRELAGAHAVPVLPGLRQLVAETAAKLAAPTARHRRHDATM